ncbi:hypothetical protein RA276_28285, partial [Pseudomonas syringae pv. tagetis]|uniref:hypothetical protein n=1 Tax=Pseudomonas syringae group genomosp. 7 TaxID=251699 RepID=UPI0037701C02
IFFFWFWFNFLFYFLIWAGRSGGFCCVFVCVVLSCWVGVLAVCWGVVGGVGCCCGGCVGVGAGVCLVWVRVEWGGWVRGCGCC